MKDNASLTTKFCQLSKTLNNAEDMYSDQSSLFK